MSIQELAEGIPPTTGRPAGNPSATPDQHTVNIARAIELDDPFPDDVCPGCGQNIAGWMHEEAHYPPGVALSAEALRWRRARGSHPMPWARPDVDNVCLWTRDYLSSRQFRRLLIAGRETGLLRQAVPA